MPFGFYAVDSLSVQLGNNGVHVCKPRPEQHAIGSGGKFLGIPFTVYKRKREILRRYASAEPRLLVYRCCYYYLIFSVRFSNYRRYTILAKYYFNKTYSHSLHYILVKNILCIFSITPLTILLKKL